jgi:pilus assembly protein CpaF
MSFELILPFLRPIEPLLLDESISEIMGNPDASWWYERDGMIFREETIRFRPAPDWARSDRQSSRQEAR